MPIRHEIRLILLAVAIVAGLALQKAGGEVAECVACPEAVEAI